MFKALGLDLGGAHWIFQVTREPHGLSLSASELAAGNCYITSSKAGMDGRSETGICSPIFPRFRAKILYQRNGPPD
jgi:hypothetical protein